MTTYTKLSPVVHLITQNISRKKAKIDITFTAGGSWFEKEGDYGKTHLLEHCIASRTAMMSFQELKDYEFKNNIYINAFTGRVSMGVNGSAHRSDFIQLADILLEMAFTPTFEESILKKEKEIVLREIAQRRGEPSYQVYFDTVKQMYTPGSLDLKEPLGDVDMVSSTTLKDLYRLHETIVNTSHVVITCSGDIDSALLTKKIQAYIQSNAILNKSTDKHLINYTPKNTLQKFRSRTLIHPYGHEHTELFIQLPCVVNYDNMASRQVFRSLFIDYNGVLYDRLREDTQLVYGLQGEYLNDTNTLQLSLSCEIHNIKAIMIHIHDIFSDFEKYYKPKRFEEFKQLTAKKQDLASDNLGAEADFAENMLVTYGFTQTYDEYMLRLDSVNTSNVQEIYEYIQEHLADIQVMIVSKDQNIEKIDF
jgi:predicted Zn-dependent peptidase